MHVAIVGAGVIGISTAYQLARLGHEVTVVDRQPGPALETSYANAGEISPGYATPWAAPGVPLKAIKWMLSAHSPLVVRPRADAAMLRWMRAFLSQCAPGPYARNKGRMIRLAEYSRDRLRALRDETGIRYDHRSLGTLQVFISAAEMKAAEKDVAILVESGVPHTLLDREGCIKREPGLAWRRQDIVGGLLLPNDETGDCHLYTTELAHRCSELGVRLRYDTRLLAIDTAGGRVRALAIESATGREALRADAYVLATASYTPGLLRPLGLSLPVYPVKGYSITAPIVDEAAAPLSTVMFERYKVAITRLGKRLRAAGTAEIAGFDLNPRPARTATILHAAQELFPGAARYAKAEPWCGLRPMTPDGTPIVGRSALDNLYFNTGHGTLGWTMACGSGHFLADLIHGTPPALAVADYAPGRAL